MCIIYALDFEFWIVWCFLMLNCGYQTINRNLVSPAFKNSYVRLIYVRIVVRVDFIGESRVINISIYVLYLAGFLLCTMLLVVTLFLYNCVGSEPWLAWFSSPPSSVVSLKDQRGSIFSSRGPSFPYLQVFFLHEKQRLILVFIFWIQ